MGAIRGFFLVIVTVLLLLSLLCVNLFLTLTLSLDYDSIQKESTVIIKNVLRENNLTNQIQELLPVIQSYCQNNSDYVFSQGGYTFDIPCSVALQGEDKIVDEGVKYLVHEVYYTGYNCNFLDCIQKSEVPLFLISEKAYDYWKSKLYLSLIISFILATLILFLVEKKTNMLLIVGSLMVVSSLPFFKLESLFSLFSNKILLQFLQSLFSKAYFISLRVLIAGIILLILGIAFKLFKVGFFVSDFISKINKKQEVVKEQPQKYKITKQNVKKPKSK